MIPWYFITKNRLNFSTLISRKIYINWNYIQQMGLGDNHKTRNIYDTVLTRENIRDVGATSLLKLRIKLRFLPFP